ncbi:MAG: hypothetical protein ACRCYY_19885 [Trueperaceae bacterium]
MPRIKLLTLWIGDASDEVHCDLTITFDNPERTARRVIGAFDHYFMLQSGDSIFVASFIDAENFEAIVNSLKAEGNIEITFCELLPYRYAVLKF